jgi:hypothetical protein
MSSEMATALNPPTSHAIDADVREQQRQRGEDAIERQADEVKMSRRQSQKFKEMTSR